MKKIAFLMWIALGVGSGCPVVRAQASFLFGVKGGLLVNKSELKYTFSGPDTQKPYDKSSTKPGFELGFQARLQMSSGFLLQPEIVYSRTSGSFPIEESTGGGGEYGETLKVRSNWIEVPVLAGWKFSIVRLMIGPVFRFPMDEVMNAGRKEAKVAPRLQNFVLGYQVGAGVDLGRWTIDARFCGNFTHITDKGVMEQYTPNLKVRERKVAFSIGYMLIK